MARILTITANPLLDFLSSQALVPGKVTRCPALSPMAAGKGINVARVLQRHGHQTCACFFAGSHTGAMLSEAVAADGIPTLAIPTRARLRIGLISAANENQAQGSLLEDGFAVEEDEAQALLDAVNGRIADQDLVIISGSVPDPRLQQLYAKIAAECQNQQVTCWIDSYGAVMDAALDSPHPPSLSKPNREEYAMGSQWANVEELHITDGGKGTTIRRPEASYQLSPPPVQEINPVGSGDCYLAGLAHARLSGWELSDQFRYAAACGAANAARWDVAQIAPGPAIDVLLPQVRISEAR
ncbi:MAG: hypothetical protein EA402_07170 [Planctomycetota bacterium]|nr:MAG: hypothetical protein EA402_07170 [Planctomycetota bacterium]